MSRNKDRKSFRQYRAGVSLVETMVALVILSVTGAAIIGLTLSLIGVNTSAKLKTSATAYAEDTVEQIRGFYQTNGFSALVSKAPIKTCYGELWTALASCPTGLADCDSDGVPILGTSYRRYFVLEQSGGGVKAQSVILWKDRAKCKTTEVDTYFYGY